MKKIILASASPRRRELLEKLGLEFKAVSGDYREIMDAESDPFELAKILSAGKAEAIASEYPGHIIIAADTFVILGEKLLGKPHTEIEAMKMLREISGKSISVITGFSVIDVSLDKKISKAVATKVHIKNLTDEEIAEYVETGEPLDKAGAFAAQGMGAVIVERIDGDFFNVVGLPLFELSKSLKELGIDVLRLKNRKK